MKVLVTGGRGFIGSEVSAQLSREHQVYSTCIEDEVGDNEYQVDLANLDSVKHVLSQVKPEAIINCAGIVTNDEKAKLNEIFTTNLLTAVNQLGVKIKKIIIMGSAGEYGEVNPNELPVNEDAPLRADSPYGVSKVHETTSARLYAKEHNIPLVVARIFNPIGLGMPPRLLIPGLQRQAEEILSGDREAIEVSRLDSDRDYIDVRDVAAAICKILSNDTRFDVYNVGTGVATSTGELVRMVLAEANLDPKNPVIETRPNKEPTFASRADISRIQSELDWYPVHSPQQVIKEIFNGTK